jgi:hypothetical protein
MHARLEERALATSITSLSDESVTRRLLDEPPPSPPSANLCRCRGRAIGSPLSLDIGSATNPSAVSDSLLQRHLSARVTKRDPCR